MEGDGARLEGRDGPRCQTPLRLAVVLWLVLGVVLWNVLFDARVKLTRRQYVYRQALFARHLGPAVDLRQTMAGAVRRGLVEASTATGLVVGAGLLVVRRASRRAPR